MVEARPALSDTAPAASSSIVWVALDGHREAITRERLRLARGAFGFRVPRADAGGIRNGPEPDLLDSL